MKEVLQLSLAHAGTFKASGRWTTKQSLAPELAHAAAASGKFSLLILAEVPAFNPCHNLI